LTKQCTEDEVKKSYKKLAIRLHPDKCGAPGAEDAFKKVSKIVSCLTDPEKRRVYDLTGSDEDGARQINSKREESEYVNEFATAEVGYGPSF
jgi:DnaJ family protein B protein 12